MKKTFLKMGCLVLVLLQLVLVFAACSGTTDGGAQGGEAGGSGEAATTMAPVADINTYRTEDFGEGGQPGRFSILARTERSFYIDCADEGDVFSMAVVERNLMVNEQFNVKVELIEGGHSDSGTSGGSFYQAVHNDVNGGVGAYDVVHQPPSWNFQGQGICLNLKTVENELSLASPWWIKDYNDNATFSQNTILTILGDAAFDTYMNLEVIYFNKTIAMSIGLDPFAMVDDGTWTIEQMMIYSELAAADNDGDGKFTAGHDVSSGDVVGIITNQSTMTPLFYCLGARYFVRTETGIVNQMLSERNIDIFNTVFAMMRGTPWNDIEGTTTLGYWDTEAFGQGNALFCLQAFRVSEDIRGSGVEFGVVPVPKLDEKQAGYFTTPYDISCFCFLKSVPNAHKSAMVLNALCATTGETIYTDYFEKVLKYQMSTDPDTTRMIEVIKNGIRIDFGEVNTAALGGICYQYGNAVLNNQKNITSMLRSTINATKKQLADFQEYLDTYE